MIICGIDPGITGGISFIQDNNSVIAERVPICSFNIGKKKKTFLDLAKIINRIEAYKPSVIFIEKQQAMPNQGVSSTFKTGFNYGLYIGTFASQGYSYLEVFPRKWKSDLQVSADKNQARQRASELMPMAKESWRLKCEDGVAESAMIAYWGINYSTEAKNHKDQMWDAL